ncbi:MAG: glutaredoxin family protein [Micrococcales bacterium]|jgi:glutaredoxin|nr:glutaredoxin family protein [Micrococcales bacterium]NBS61733.1 glutaredoxin family protein [Microbacteriaceae bacterium]NBS85966.1 glutaredoxin family protein [Micrococcales bacterium]NBX94443.1 glutaredoxin family protein [Actinomycetota bacterium]
MSTTIDLTLIGKSGCHLCDEARVTVNAVVGAFRAEYTGVARHIQVNLVEHDILVDEELWNKYSEEVPVLLINGKIHNYWRIDPVRLRGALEEFVR